MPGEHAGICSPAAVLEYSSHPMNSLGNQLYVNRDRGLFILAVTPGERAVWSLCSMCVVRRNKQGINVFGFSQLLSSWHHPLSFAYA